MTRTSLRIICRTWYVFGGLGAKADRKIRTGGPLWKSLSPSRFVASKTYKACSTFYKLRQDTRPQAITNQQSEKTNTSNRQQATN